MTGVTLPVIVAKRGAGDAGALSQGGGGGLEYQANLLRRGAQHFAVTRIVHQKCTRIYRFQMKKLKTFSGKEVCHPLQTSFPLTRQS